MSSVISEATRRGPGTSSVIDVDSKRGTRTSHVKDDDINVLIYTQALGSVIQIFFFLIKIFE